MPVDGWGVMQRAAELARRGEAFALATVVWRQGPSSSQQGARAIITADGDLQGWIGGACAEPVVVREAQEVISSGLARLLLLGSPDQFGSPDHVPEGMVMVPIACQSEGALEVYIEPVLPVPHLIVVGSSPMATTLADMATALGWQTDLIAGQGFTGAEADERSLIVVATQGHDDEGVLERAVAARPAYLGLVGSHRRGEAVLGYLADRGLDADLLSRVRTPAGLDLGPTTHREIAVAILAELVRLRATGALRTPGRSDQSAVGTASGQPASAGPAASGRQVAAAADPVCGMTIDLGPASRTTEYRGRAYYFCGPGCQQAFDADPAAYLKRETRC